MLTIYKSETNSQMNISHSLKKFNHSPGNIQKKTLFTKHC